MNLPSDAHLSEDQIEEFLMDLSSELGNFGSNSFARRHLVACEHCRTVLETERTQLSQALAAFDQASLASAQARSNTIPLQLAPRRTGFVVPAWSLAGGVAIAIGFSMQLATPPQPTWSEPMREALVQAQPVELAETSDIAQDNLLLSNIGQAIDAPVASPTTLFHAPASVAEFEVRP